MSFIGKAIGKAVDISAKPFGYITGAEQAKKAAKKAGKIQSKAAQAAIDEQRRQFDKFIELMSPYVAAGAPALEQQQALIGLKGPEAEQAAIEAIASSPQLQALAQQGEQAMLQQASATGGLRGGNIQAALAQFRPQLLQQLIEQRYGRLGGMTGLGVESSSIQGQQGLNVASNIGNLLLGKASAQAGSVIAQGNAQRQLFGDVMQIAGLVAGVGGFGGGSKFAGPSFSPQPFSAAQFSAPTTGLGFGRTDF
jgi:hypothetical protein